MTHRQHGLGHSGRDCQGHSPSQYRPLMPDQLLQVVGRGAEERLSAEFAKSPILSTT